jgi:EB module
VTLGDSCDSKKECSAADSYCHNNRCQCNDGFVQRKDICINVDECEVGYPNKCVCMPSASIKLGHMIVNARMDFAIIILRV